jgi:hypothetical protein
MNGSILIIEKSGVRHFVELFHVKKISIEGTTVLVDYGYNSPYIFSDVVNINAVNRALKKKLWFSW